MTTETWGERMARAIKRSSISEAANGVAAVAALTAGVAFFVTTRLETRSADSASAAEVARISAINDQLAARISGLQRRLDVSRDDVTLPKDAADLKPLIARMTEIEYRQARIEKAISNDPARALEIPLLRRDIDGLKEANGQAIGAVKASVDQVYDLSKWLFGALVIGVFSLAVSNYLTRKGS